MQYVYRTETLFVVVKPAGMAVQTQSDGQTTVVDAVRSETGYHDIQPVHRIDQPVAGLVILARPPALTHLHGAFADAQVERRYLAVIEGLHAIEPRTVVHWLVDDDRHTAHAYQSPPPHAPSAQKASLELRPLGQTRHHTALIVTLHTGRHHQIRAQLAAEIAPIVGDARYGARRSTQDRSIALLAWQLAVGPPALESHHRWVAPFPESSLWRAVAELPALAAYL